MKIKRVEVKPFDLRYREAFSLSRGSLEAAPLAFILVTSDEDLRGISYAPGSAPFIDGETVESIAAAVNNVIAPAIIGRDPSDIESIMADIDRRLVFNYRAKAGVELAIYDLLGKALGLPLFKLWGGMCREKVPVARMVGIASPEVMAQRAKELVEEGFRYLKVKVDVQLSIHLLNVYVVNSP